MYIYDVFHDKYFRTLFIGVFMLKKTECKCMNAIFIYEDDTEHNLRLSWSSLLMYCDIIQRIFRFVTFYVYFVIACWMKARQCEMGPGVRLLATCTDISSFFFSLAVKLVWFGCFS